MGDEWLVFDVAGFAMRFQYPAELPSGKPYVIEETETAVMVRRHLRTFESSELYFEVRRYTEPREAREGYQLFVESLRQQFEVVEIEALSRCEIGGEAAVGFGFEWPEAQRETVFVERPDGLYRIIYDPTLPLNLQILQSVTFI